MSSPEHSIADPVVHRAHHRDADDDQARQFAEEARQMVEMGTSRPPG